MHRLADEKGNTVLAMEEGGRLHWVIGRDKRCDLELHDTGVSRVHATLFRGADGYYLLDHSLNGTHICHAGERPGRETRLPSISPAECASRIREEMEQMGEPLHKPAMDTAEINIADVKAELDRLQKVAAGESPEDRLNKSHAEFQAMKKDTLLPRVAGYAPHQMKTPEDLRSFLEMIYSADQVETLAGMSRRIADGDRLIFVGKSMIEVAFEA